MVYIDNGGLIRDQYLAQLVLYKLFGMNRNDLCDDDDEIAMMMRSR
jgi:hypothetical protein